MKEVEQSECNRIDSWLLQPSDFSSPFQARKCGTTTHTQVAPESLRPQNGRTIMLQL